MILIISILGILFASSKAMGQATSEFDRILGEALKEKTEEDRLIAEEIRKKEEEFDRLWEDAKREIEKKWETAYRSTKKEWVDYYADFNSMSRVNFETGSLEVAAVIPLSEEDLTAVAQDRISRQIEEIFSQKNPARVEPLAGQVRDKKGDIVTREKLQKFISQEVLPTIVIERKERPSRDGVKRAVAKITLPLAPDHLKVRAEQYLEMVGKYSEEYHLDTELILAVIHTESYFNPMARSSAHAYGLMQLIPSQGAREAYRFIYGSDKIIFPEELFVPETNIHLGSAYLHFIRNKIFSEVRTEAKRTYLAICSYNWGPGAVKKNIVGRYPIGKVSDEELFQILREKTPAETSAYLKNVTERTSLYRSFLSDKNK